MCNLARSLFDRGLTAGSTGNISSRTADGGLLVTPTGSSFGRLDPARLSIIDANGNHVDGDPPTKEMPLHMAFYSSRPQSRAVVHLHSHHAVAWSLFEDVDPECFIPTLSPYPIMKLGKVKLLPYLRPGDPAMGEAVEALGGAFKAVMLSNHGPVVAAKTVEAACDAIEELEDGARRAVLTRGARVRGLTSEQIEGLVKHFDIDW